MPIHVVIVESHHHALEHIHSVLRKKKILMKPWTMVHFDAHPDLACPTAPAVACFTPRRPLELDPENSLNSKNFYECLDSSSSGIAEWILPLVLAADLRVVQWVRPSFARQLPDGVHRFRVGAFDSTSADAQSVESFTDLSNSALIRVDYEHPYYWDDNSTVSSYQNLVLTQTLELHVSELDGVTVSTPCKRENTIWSLDICLDYFSCLNPYLSDIDDIDPAITGALVKVMQTTRMYAKADNQPSRPQYLEDLFEFRSILKEFLEASNEATSTNTLLDELTSFYDDYSFDQSKEFLSRLKQQIGASSDGNTLTVVLEAIPCWNMPHMRKDSVHFEEIDASLSRMGQVLMQRNSEPFLITIARSAEDGFTPVDEVEQIQNRVLGMLHSAFCKNANCSNGRSDCFLRITRDYGEWEGCTIFPES